MATPAPIAPAHPTTTMVPAAAPLAPAAPAAVTAHPAAGDKASVSNTHVRDVLASTQLNGWSLATNVVQATKDGSSAGNTIQVVATKGTAVVESPVTAIGTSNVIELFDSLARGVLEACH